MVRTNWKVFEEDYWAINTIMKELLSNSNSASVLLLDKTGQLISSVGEEPDFDMHSFASLCAADFEANAQLAKLIGEKEFSILFHEGRKDNIHISIVGQRLILVVIFDERSSLGLVRLRVRKATGEVERILVDMDAKAQSGIGEDAGSPFAEITDDDIDALFSE